MKLEWNKMKSFKQYITELFEKPYPFKQTDTIDHNVAMAIERINNDSFDEIEYAENGGTDFSEARYTFKTDDGRTIRVDFEYELHLWFSECEINFSDVGSKKRKNKASNSDYEATGEGDEFKIMSTVMAIISKEISNVSPTRIIFESMKSERVGDTSRRMKTGRTKLYKTMVKRFAGKLGYKVKNMEEKVVDFRFVLEKK
tara:strand:+ start:204 stop:803 length:600 start_codon:yes stop_codon:yes gene_type:complete